MDNTPISGNAPLIFGKMVAILKEVESIGKDNENKDQKFKYRGIDDVYNALNPLLSKYGVFMTSEILSKDRQERTTRSGGILAFTTLRMRFNFIAEDGSSVATEVEGEGMDSGDKSSNKAMSVGHKYALLQAFCIPTKDFIDPDKESHEVIPEQAQPRPQTAPRTVSEGQTAAAQPENQRGQPSTIARAANAKAWAEEATHFVLSMADAKALETWNTKNAKAIAAAQSLAPAPHKNLIAAIDKRRSDLNPKAA